MSIHQELSNFIWGICDDVLRGLFKPHEYGDVILPFVVLRRLDCVLEPQKDKVYDLYNQYKDKVKDPTPIILDKVGTSFFNTSKFDLKRLKQDPQNIYLNFNNYINGYDDNVREIIENFQLDKPVEKLNKNNRLFLLIDRFTEVDLHPDKVNNRMMGQVYEELLRRFSEMSNETSGDHYTPRDVVRLLVSLLFSGEEENLKGKGIVRSLFDPCSGTGGLLTMGKEWVKENINKDVDFILFGQELNPQTYSICKSDMMMLGENPNNIKGPSSSLSDDHFQGKKFDYQITNPPFGVSWKSDEEFVKNESSNPHGRFFIGTPRVSDGSLLFLQHMVSKMEDKGGRIGIVLNGSPLFTGDSGSGESEIRKWIIENDWLECIVSLPDQLFFNTGITTYIWIVTNKKKKQRRGKVQLINGSTSNQTLRKNLGGKRKFITDEQIDFLTNVYKEFTENEYSKIFPNEFFGYTKVTIEQPLKNEKGKVVLDKNGKPKPDSSLRDYERVPLMEDINEYYEREVQPHLPESWMDRDKDKVGYEINFTKYFYQYKPLRSLKEITDDLLQIEKESEGLFYQIMESK
jgi:type I restriction enzyme M protein